MKKLINKIRIWFAKRRRNMSVKIMVKAADIRDRSLKKFHYYDDLISELEESM